jgi:hypothetical protein
MPFSGLTLVAFYVIILVTQRVGEVESRLFKESLSDGER